MTQHRGASVRKRRTEMDYNYPNTSSSGLSTIAMPSSASLRWRSRGARSLLHGLSLPQLVGSHSLAIQIWFCCFPMWHIFPINNKLHSRIMCWLICPRWQWGDSSVLLKRTELIVNRENMTMSISINPDSSKWLAIYNNRVLAGRHPDIDRATHPFVLRTTRRATVSRRWHFIVCWFDLQL